MRQNASERKIESLDSTISKYRKMSLREELESRRKSTSLSKIDQIYVMHSENYRHEIHAFHGRKVLMKYRLQKITWETVIYYDIVQWDHHDFAPQDEIHAQEDEEMERVSLKFAVGCYCSEFVLMSREVNLRE